MTTNRAVDDGHDRISAELFQILKKIMLLKCCTQYASKFGTLSSGQRPGKGQSNYCITVLFSHASKVMLKILKARPQQNVNRELPDVQAGFKKGKGARD